MEQLKLHWSSNPVTGWVRHWKKSTPTVPLSLFISLLLVHEGLTDLTWAAHLIFSWYYSFSSSSSLLPLAPPPHALKAIHRCSHHHPPSSLQPYETSYWNFLMIRNNVFLQRIAANNLTYTDWLLLHSSEEILLTDAHILWFQISLSPLRIHL